MMTRRQAIAGAAGLGAVCCCAPVASAAWVHNLDPFLWQISGSFGLRWYPLAYLAAFFVGYLMLHRVMAVGRNTPDPKLASELVFQIAIGVMLGGRLGYVLFYQPSLLVDFRDSLPFWGVLAINEGGMASHGGIIGGVLASVLFARRHKMPGLFMLDLFAFGAPPGLFFGRLANFVNGELYGRPCAADFPLAVRFPQEIYDPTVFDQATVFGEVQMRYGQPLPRHLDIPQMVQSGDGAMVEVMQAMLTPRHPSQLYAALLEGAVTFAVLMWIYRRPVKAGTVGCWFCMTYAVMRIANEFFRMPDSHLIDREFAAVGVTRGQWLSVLLFLVGPIALVFIRRSAAAPMGGWRRSPDPAESGSPPPPDRSAS